MVKRMWAGSNSRPFSNMPPGTPPAGRSLGSLCGAGIRITLMVALALMALPLPAGAETVAGSPMEPGVWSWFTQLAGQPMLVLLGVVVTGLLLGQIKIGGVSLGASGVLFMALVAGYFNLSIIQGLGQLGLVVFVYCVGLSAGPTFFSAFKRQGKQFVILSLVIVGSGALIAYVAALVLGIPHDLAGGLFTGALTSTPGLAAGLEAAGGESAVAVGYGLAYPFGVIGVVLLVQLVPRLLGKDLESLGAETQLWEGANGPGVIKRIMVRVTNPAVVGLAPSEVPFGEEVGVVVAKRLVGGQLFPVEAGYLLKEGDQVLVITGRSSLDQAVGLLGERSGWPVATNDGAQHRQRVIVTASGMLNVPLARLSLLEKYGVIVSRITRQEHRFVPNGTTTLHRGDRITVVGGREQLDRFAKVAGHNPRALEMTDIYSLGVGMVLGILLGMVKVPLPGGGTFSLGMAGGPLFVGLLLGHLGQLGPITAYMPRASRLLLTEIGLVFFLADAGVYAGSRLAVVLANHGLTLLAAGAVVTLVPMVVAYFVARSLLKMDVLSTLGGICGGMTSTPGLGAITARTDAQAPVVGYTSAYPVALLLMTLVTKALIALLS